ncbi:MAG: helicase-related protein, partial [Acidaminococcaceae bacterium]
MFNELLGFLTKLCHATVLLSTATQPLLDKMPQELTSIELAPENEISGCGQSMHDLFKRTEFVNLTKTKKMTVDNISKLVWEQALADGNSLVILNTKSAVKQLYQKTLELFGDLIQAHGFQVYFLTTNLYPRARKERIEEIKAQLAASAKIIVISTQLIEAGVDVSFKNVFRSLAGLDNLVQSAGRCNRHGSNGAGDYGKIYLIEPDFEKINSLRDISIGKKVTKLLLQKGSLAYEQDLGSLKVIEGYFRQYLSEQEQAKNMKYAITTKRGIEVKLYDLL